MARTRGWLASLIATVALLSACADDNTGPERAAADLPSLSATAQACPGTLTLKNVKDAATVAFGRSSPDVKSVLGKLDNLESFKKKGQTAQARARAYEIVDFTLDKHKNKPLVGGDDKVGDFITKLYCYVGLQVTVESAANATLLLPGDAPQVVYDTARTIGIKFPANPVTTPTLITIAELQSTEVFTKLDQYPLYYRVRATSDDPDGNPFTPDFSALVGVCAEAPAFLFGYRKQNGDSVPPRLRLGHGLLEDGEYTGFEIAEGRYYDPELGKEGILLQCPEPTEPGIAADDVPGELTTTSRSGGIGGTVKTFSPFSIVDEEVTARSGGIGGTVKTFDYLPFLWGKYVQDACLLDTPGNVFDAPAGTVTECRPTVTIMTFKRLWSLLDDSRPRADSGNVFADVQVDWEVLDGGGTITLNKSGLGEFDGCQTSYGPTLTTGTGPLGRASVCWKLGTTVGTDNNTLRATVRSALQAANGEVPKGARFDSDGVELFTASALEGQVFVQSLRFTQQPDSVVQLGAATSAEVEVLLSTGARAVAFQGLMTLTLVPPIIEKGVVQQTWTADVVDGLATFSELFVEGAPGSGYTLVATIVDGQTTITSDPSNPFRIAQAPSVPTELRFDGSPFTTWLLCSPPTLQFSVVDQYGVTSSSYADSIVVDLYKDAQLIQRVGGQLAASGTATFSGINLVEFVNGDYTVRASASYNGAELKNAQTTAFTVSSCQIIGSRVGGTRPPAPTGIRPARPRP